MGLGPPPVVNQNEINQFVSIVSDLAMSSLQQCTQLVQFSQAVTMTCNVPSEVAIAFASSPACLACATNTAGNPSIDCDPFCKACVQTGVNQSAVVSLTLECQTDSNQAASIKNDFDTKIAQEINNQQSVLSTMFSFLPNFNSSKQQNVDKVKIVSNVQNLLTLSNVQQLLNEINVSQVVNIVSNGGGSSQGGITQTLLFYSVSTLIARNLQDLGVENAVSLTATQGISNKSGGDSGSSLTIIGIAVVVLVIGGIMLIVLMQLRKKQPAA